MTPFQAVIFAAGSIFIEAFHFDLENIFLTPGYFYFSTLGEHHRATFTTEIFLYMQQIHEIGFMDSDYACISQQCFIFMNGFGLRLIQLKPDFCTLRH
jgi:hypothetical protein